MSTKTLTIDDLPEVTTGFHLPSYTDEEIYDNAGNLGVYSAGPRHFKFCFDILVHREGVLMYRMKPNKDRKIKVDLDKNDHAFFKGIMFHDPMEVFVSYEQMTEHGNPNNIAIASTHSNEEGPLDYWECYGTVPYDEFSHYLDKINPMDNFWNDVKQYFGIKKEC